MTPDTEPTVVNDEHTRKARSMMDQLRALRDATTDPEVIAEISDEMDCVALSWQIRELFDEEEKTSPQPEPQLIARTHQQRAISSSRHFNSHANCRMADREGFEPSVPIKVHTLSRRAR
jgi:hypothetical protein